MAAVAQISARQLLLLDFKLENLNNWGASPATNNASDTTYATAGAVKKAYDLAFAALPATANAVSATKLATARTFALTGDATATATFDGTANVGLAVTLADSGVVAGSWGKVTVDSKGRVTAGTALVAADIPVLDWSKITSGKPTTLAGYGITDALGLNSNAVSATKLATARTFALTGDATATATFDGTANVGLAVTLADSGVVAGSWGKVTVDSKGRVTAGTALVAADIPALDWSKITSGKPTTLAGYGITDALGLNSNAVSATKLATARTFALTGDATATATFDGTANVGLAVTLADSGVVAGSWGKVTVDSKGRVTAGTALVAADIPALDWSKITSGKPTTLAGYGITDALGLNSNAVSATKLATGRTLTVGGTGKAFDGTANLAWSLGEIGALPATGGGITGDFWRASGNNQFGLVDHLGSHTDAKACLVLLAKKYVGTLINKTGFVGRIMFSRGSSGSQNFTDFVDVSVGVAYNSNMVRLLRRSGPTVAASKIVEVTYSGEVYYALYRPSSSSSEVVVTGHAFDAALPLLVPDATAYTLTDVVADEEDYHVGNKPTSTDIGLGNVDNAQQMRAALLNGYWGLVPADGNATTWVRTPGSGLLPYQSGGASALGTSAWPFLTAYVNTIFEGGVSLAAKYLGVSANAVSASKWATARTITLAGDATGSVSIDGSANVTLTVAVADDSHSHTIGNIDGLQATLDAKALGSHVHMGTIINPFQLGGQDLNTLVTPGVYAQHSNSNTSAALNYPENLAGALTITSGAGPQQRYHVYNTSRIYTRAQYSTGGFTPWARDYNSLNKPTSDDVGLGKLSNKYASYDGTPDTYALRDGQGDIVMRTPRAALVTEQRMTGAVVFRVDNGNDNYLRYCASPQAFRNWLNTESSPWSVAWRLLVEDPANALVELHIPGKAAVLSYLTADGMYRIATSNGAGTATATRMTVDTSGNVRATGGVYDAGQRVYSPNNPPHNSHNHTAAQGNADIVSGAWNAIGATVFAQMYPADSLGTYAPGSRIPGSYLRPCSADGDEDDMYGASLPGTWQCQGYSRGRAVGENDWLAHKTAWIRVA
ncbi:hypothetical protein [Aeromonas salmonicida]|uniref:hypothetical protein n=1 Tax=Aeromonas salmonicida TaxID=645 RepID=UPI00232D66FA|nr:hypothetical protein [Aeromonas salmonicida]WCH25177.1 hypothetical protein ONZ54_23205 [Aeromonas salmonicida]